MMTNAASSTRTPEGHARRGDIVATAARLFDSDGYHATSMGQLAAAVGIAKPTLYHYFTSKAEILVEIHDVLITPLIEQHEARRDAGAPPDAQVYGVISDILTIVDSHRAHCRVFFEHHRELPPRSRRRFGEQRARYEHMLVTAIEEGNASGVFAVEQPRLAALAVFGICNWAYQWWPPSVGASPTVVAEYFWRILRPGLGPAAPSE